jgi:hypothetical protein
MIIPLASLIAGAGLGALVARRRDGNGFDMAQWAAVWGIIGGLLGMVALIVLSR